MWQEIAHSQGEQLRQVLEPCGLYPLPRIDKITFAIASDFELLVEVTGSFAAKDVACAFSNAGFESRVQMLAGESRRNISKLHVAPMAGGVRFWNYKIKSGSGLEEEVAAQFSAIRNEYETVLVARVGEKKAPRLFEIVHGSGVHKLTVSGETPLLAGARTLFQELSNLGTPGSFKLETSKTKVSAKTASRNTLLDLVGRAQINSLPIASVAMAPAVELGDKILWTKTDSVAKRGELVVLRIPDGRTVLRRIVGVGSDEIELEGGALLVNGKRAPTRDLGAYALEGFDPSTNSYARLEGRLVEQSIGDTSFLTSRFAGSTDSGKWKLDSSQIFVLGDNREHSEDSRTWGALPADTIVGRPIAIWLAFFKGELKIERMGRPL